MKKYFHFVFVLFSGVLSSQILFSGLVYFSNIFLHENLAALKNSGYLIVPNDLVMPSLQNIVPAICGGLFFSLTAGAGLSFITLFIFILWRRYSSQIWVLAALFAVNIMFFLILFDFNIPVTLVCTLTSGTVIYTALIFFPEKFRFSIPFLPVLSVHLAVIIIIALIWMPVVNKDVFISIRDNLLFSNPIGQKINNFYYKYTLYPAETFKSLNQKLLKTCHLHIDQKNINNQVKNRLMTEDYLPVEDRFYADLTVELKNDTLIFLHQQKVIHRCLPDEFLKTPEQILELFSDKIDDKKHLRKITFLSLISASPLLCYIFLHALLMIILLFIKSELFRFACSSLICLIMFTLPAVSFYHLPPEDIDESSLAKFLKSNNRHERIGAFKTISDKNLALERFTDPVQLKHLINSPQIAERYWLAQSLAGSDSKESYQMILSLLEDPHPNVVCMALYSLGKQHKSDAKDLIINRIRNDKHWYVQWYAYKALKRLRWTQKK